MFYVFSLKHVFFKSIQGYLQHYSSQCILDVLAWKRWQFLGSKEIDITFNNNLQYFRHTFISGT